MPSHLQTNALVTTRRSSLDAEAARALEELVQARSTADFELAAKALGELAGEMTESVHDLAVEVLLSHLSASAVGRDFGGQRAACDALVAIGVMRRVDVDGFALRSPSELELADRIAIEHFRPTLPGSVLGRSA